MTQKDILQIVQSSNDDSVQCFKVPYGNYMEFTAGDLADILITALESPYDWFAMRTSSIKREQKDGEDKRFIELGIEDYYPMMAPALQDGNISFKIEDHDSSPYTMFNLDRNKLLSGIFLYLNPNNNNAGVSHILRRQRVLSQRIS